MEITQRRKPPRRTFKKSILCLFFPLVCFRFVLFFTLIFRPLTDPSLKLQIPKSLSVSLSDNVKLGNHLVLGQPKFRTNNSNF